MKNILIINGNPKKDSFCNSLVEKYRNGAEKASNIVKILHIRDLELGSYIKFDHTSSPTLSKELKEARDLITWANHLVFVYPTWWATPPAQLKIFLEIALGSGFAFKYKKSKGIAPSWDKLLTNKSAHVISTMDSPPFYYSIVTGDPGFKMMKDILNFCGVKPVKKTYFGSVKMSDSKKKTKWLNTMYKQGLRA